jgi:hypothetical protein
MKKICFAALIITTVFLTYSCSSDDDGNSTDNSSIAAVVNTMNSGTWRITKYIDNANDETTDFSGYNFTFTQNNILMASNDTEEIMGSWLVSSGNSNDDNPSNDLDFIISFLGPAKFMELSDDWDIQSRTSTKLELIDVSGGNGGTDYLTFEKN